MAKKVVGFINTDRLTLCVKVLLWIQVAVASVSILISYLEYGLLSDFLNGVYTSQEMAEADAEVNDLFLSIYCFCNFHTPLDPPSELERAALRC